MSLSFGSVSTKSGVNVIATSTLLLAANPSRIYASFQNTGAKTVYIGLGVAAEVLKGVQVVPGATYEFTENGPLCVGPIYAIGADAGPQKVLVQEA